MYVHNRGCFRGINQTTEALTLHHVVISRRSVVLSEPSSRGFVLRGIKSGRPGGRYGASSSSSEPTH